MRKKAYTKRKTENSVSKLLTDIVDCIICFLITEYMESVTEDFLCMSMQLLLKTEFNNSVAG